MKTKLLVLGALFASLCASVQGQTPTPVLHLSFDNVSGTTVINDGSGAGMNGTLNGAGATIVPGGMFGNALQVTGSASSDVSCRIASAVVPLNVQAGNAWTLACWIKTSTKGATWMYQGDGGWASGNTTFFTALNNGSTGNNSDAAGGVRYASGWQQGTTTVDNGVWHHIVFTWDGTTKSEYVDGVLETWVANGWNNSAGTGAQFWIGGAGNGQGDGQVCLNGLIDEAYVFDVALSVSDVNKLYNNNSLTITPVPVAVTVSPDRGLRGTVVTVTATATPASGTATNAVANLSGLGLTNAFQLVQSSPNVFTNSFTVPTKAPIGLQNVIVTVRDTEPLVGSGAANFFVLAVPPTNTIIVTQLTSQSAYAYDEVSFHFAATNDAPNSTNNAFFPMTYAWYTNGVLVSTNPMGPYYTFLTTPDNNNLPIQCIASVVDNTNYYSSLSVTSAVVTLTVNPGTPVYTNGLKQEFFAGATRARVEIGNVGPGIISLVTNADSAGGFGDNHARRYSGYFIPQTTGAYVFFVASDDDCDVFLSTDSSPANKQLIAQEGGWSGKDNWQTPGGNGSVASQKRSDQWSPDGGSTVPYSTGIILVAGQKYYLEYVMHNGGGGDNCGVTYQTMSELALDGSLPLDGTASRMTAASNNIAVVTWPGTSINWSLQPKTSVTVFEGQNTNFSAIAVSDAEMTPYYQWYLVTSGGSLPGTPLTGNVVNGTNLNMSLIPANYDNAQIYCIASTEIGGISVTSSVATLHVIQSVFEPGWVSEKKWLDQFNMGGLEAGTVGNPLFSCVRAGFLAGLDNPGTGGGSGHDSMIQQIGYFVPPANGNYVLFITSHDGGDLFLSTDNTALHKRLVAQEAGWSGNFAWNSAGGGGTVVSQKRSDTYSPDSGVTTPYAAGIPLVAGQRYYMEVDHTTSKWGNEQFGVDYRIMSGGSVTAPADGSLPNCNGNVVGMSATRCSYVAFAQQPTNVTVAPLGYATFNAASTTDSQYPVESSYGYTIVAPTNPLLYQWYKNGSPIAGATSMTLSLGPLMPSDNGAQIYCTMRALGYANDALTPIWSNSLTATITISPQAVFETGVATINWWTNASVASVENGAVGNPQFSYTTPKFEGPTGNTGKRGYATSMDGYFIPPINGNYIFFVNSDGPSDLFISTNSNPANKQIVAKETGWSDPFRWTTIGATWGGGGSSIATQKRSDQYTPDVGVTYPGNPGSIGGIPMVAGQKYYMEGVHQAGGGNDHIEVTYIVAGDADPVLGSDSMLTGDLIGTYFPRIPWVAFLQQPTNQTELSGTPVTFTAQGTNPPSVWIGTTGNPWNWMSNPNTVSAQYQWYEKTTASGAFVSIPGATSSSYTLPYALPSDQNAQFVCALHALGYSDDSLNRIYSNSVAAVLTVVTDTVPPTISYAATFENTNQVPPQFIVNVTFSKWMNAASLSNATYTVSGATVTNVSIASNHRTVQLLLNQMPTSPLTVTVSGVTDLSGNPLAGNSATTNLNAERLNFSDVGTPGYDPAYPSHIWIAGSGGYIIAAEGSDIWNANDGCNFGWELKTNDFDVAVRGVSITPTSQWAKLGLMARETLDATSREWSIQNEPLAADGGNNRVDTAMRDTTGAASVGWQLTSGALPPPSYPNAWLRLTRTISGTNDVLDGFYSTNGISWVHATSYNVATNATPLTNVVYVGLCTTAHNNDVVSDPPPSPFLYYNTAEYANYNSVYVAHPKLTVSVSGGNVIVSWDTGTGRLQSSPALQGAGVNWQDVSTTSPATIPIGTGSQFFRVVTP